MTSRTRVRFLPGDLIDLSGSGNLAIVVSMYNTRTSPIVYRYMSRNEYSFTDMNYMIGTMPAYPRKDVKLLHRVFHPNRNYICSDENCEVRNLLGECMYCNYKIDYSKDDKIFFPGDEVWSPSRKQSCWINQANLCIPVLSDGDTGYETIAEGTKWDDIHLAKFFERINYFNSSYSYYVDISALYNHLLERFETNPPTLTYREKPSDLTLNYQDLPRDLNIREQSKLLYYIPEDINICPMCIYQDSDKCSSCITKKLIRRSI